MHKYTFLTIESLLRASLVHVMMCSNRPILQQGEDKGGGHSVSLGASTFEENLAKSTFQLQHR